MTKIISQNQFAVLDAMRAGALEEILETAVATSPMYDNIRNSTPITSRLEVVTSEQRAVPAD